MQQRGMDSILRRTDQRTVDFVSTLVAKAPVFFLAVLSGGILARTALPAVAGALSSGATPLWSASRPLYPFFVVNLIIFVIWRLSDWEQLVPAEGKPPEEKPPEVEVMVKVKSSGTELTEPLLRKPSPETWKKIPASSSPFVPVVPDVVPITLLVPQHVELPRASEKSVVCSELGTKIEVSENDVKVDEEEMPALEDTSKGEMEEEDEEDEEENPPMEVMWKTIMEKRSRETATTSRQVTPPRGQRQQEAMAAWPLPVLGGRAPSSLASRDESNRLYDDFIMKHHNRMR